MIKKKKITHTIYRCCFAKSYTEGWTLRNEFEKCCARAPFVTTINSKKYISQRDKFNWQFKKIYLYFLEFTTYSTSDSTHVLSKEAA